MKHIKDEIELIKSKKSRNRIVMLPMDTYQAKDGVINEFHIQHYGSRAYGGVGTIICETNAVSPEGRITDEDMGIYSDNQIDGMKKLVDIVHKGGSIIGTQLNHAGAKSRATSETKYGTSTRFFDYIDNSNLKVLSIEDLKTIEEKFVASAKRAKESGFDFVEIHGAHGYLLSMIMNYEGNDIIKDKDINIRASVVASIIRRIHDEVKIPVGLRVSFSSFDEDKFTLEEFIPLLKTIEKYITYINVSPGGIIFGKQEPKDSLFGMLFRIPLASELKKHTKVNVIVGGNFSSADDINKALGEGIDAVGLGKQLLFNPYTVITDFLDKNDLDENIYHWNGNKIFKYKEYKK